MWFINICFYKNIIKDKRLKIDKQSYYNLISNLGLIEQRRIDFITRGTLNLSKDLTKNPSLCIERTGRIHSYIQSILLLTDIISNYGQIAIPELEIKSIYDKMSSDDSKKTQTLGGSESIMKLMFSTNYFLASMEVKKIHAGDVYLISQFTFEYLLSFILKVHSKLKKIGVTQFVLDEVIILLVNVILDGEKITSKLLDNKEASINAVHKISMEYDPNMVDNRQSRSYDDLVDPDEIDKFSYNNLDYDGHNDQWD